MKALENWIVNLLAMPLKAINENYRSDEDVRRELKLLPLCESEGGYTHAGSEVSEEILFRLHAKIKRQPSENDIWVAVIWYLSTPLPLKLAHDLIDRNIAVTDMVYSPQLDEIMWRLATFDDDALYALVSERYTSSKYSVSQFKNILQQYVARHEYVLNILSERQASSRGKQAVFEKAVRELAKREETRPNSEEVEATKDPAEVVLSQINWTKYEENVLATVQKAIAKYCKRYAKSEDNQIYQVSIWTDPQVAQTSISFETKAHARQELLTKIQFFIKEKLPKEAKQLETLGYNTNPADFRFPCFQTKVHRELDTLTELDYTNATTSTAVDARLETSLSRVAKQIIDAKILDKLPREETIFLGVSSPRDWYDHVVKVK
jgi:hypothetical protein